VLVLAAIVDEIVIVGENGDVTVVTTTRRCRGSSWLMSTFGLRVDIFLGFDIVEVGDVEGASVCARLDGSRSCCVGNTRIHLQIWDVDALRRLVVAWIGVESVGVVRIDGTIMLARWGWNEGHSDSRKSSVLELMKRTKRTNDC